MTFKKDKSQAKSPVLGKNHQKREDLKKRLQASKRCVDLLARLEKTYVKLLLMKTLFLMVPKLTISAKKIQTRPHENR